MQDNDDPLMNQPVELPDSGPQYQLPKSVRRRGGKGKVVLICLAILIVLGGLGASAWFFLRQRAATPAAQPPPAATSSEPTTDTVDTSQLKTFKSELLHLQISHPATWTASEKDGGLTVTSPDFSYETTDKGTVTGAFRLYIRQGAREQDGKRIGAGVVIQPSEKLAYQKPSSSQRKETILSQFGALVPDHFTFMMVTSDYQLNKGDQLGVTYGREPETYIIVGGYGTKDQAEDLAFNNVPLDDFAAKRAYTQAVSIIKSLQLD